MSISPTTRLKIGAYKKGIEYIANNTNMDYEQVLNLIQNILQEVLNSVISDLEVWINEKVPKRTGQLRESLIQNLHSSRVAKGLLRIILGTHLEYASDVNAMSTAQVRHGGELGYAYYYGHYGRIILNDPQAIGGFWGALLQHAEERAVYHLDRVKNQYTGTGGIPAQYMRRIKTHE